MKKIYHPLAMAIALAPESAAFAAETGKPLELEANLVSASALSHSPNEMTSPARVVQGDELTLRREATLGETLDGLPGVHSSSFGAGASRPVIRGLDGARVRVLSDGVDSLDASTISPDHAVSLEPMLLERIEVLKGPATLLYGGGAIGGVVNLIDRKVPTHIPENGYEGEAELRANSVANGGAGAFGLTAGAGQFAMRVEGVKRQDDEYRIPGAEGDPRSNRQVGSYNDTDTATLGGSWIGERGHLGLAYTRQANRYGLLAHEHVDCHTHDPRDWHCGGHDDHDEHDDHDHDHGGQVPYIDMQQRRWDLRGDYREPLPGVELGRLRIGHSQYRHDEVEGGVTATTFRNDATDARLELTHAPLLGWRGVFGGQTLRRDFQALGEEAYVPPTLTRNHGLFLLEEYRAGDWRYELGLRHEWQAVDADGQRSASHRGNSVSAGAVWDFAPEYALGLTFSRSQRLPTAEELYANGPHAATRTVELGDPGLDEETSRNVELSLRKHSGRARFSLSLYRNQVDDFIFAADTGRDIGGGVREIQYSQADALLTGAEGEASYQFTEATRATTYAAGCATAATCRAFRRTAWVCVWTSGWRRRWTANWSSTGCSARVTSPLSRTKRGATTCSGLR